MQPLNILPNFLIASTPGKVVSTPGKDSLLLGTKTAPRNAQTSL